MKELRISLSEETVEALEAGVAAGDATSISELIEAALDESGAELTELDAIAATAGPGLIGGLLVGLMTGKALAAATGRPLFAVNHLEGHALSARLEGNVAFPYLMLLVSGGHTQIVLVRGPGRYERWASTIDDALGEAFDKTAKLLGLPYPGGPEVEKLAREGNAGRFDFPRPLKGRQRLLRPIELAEGTPEVAPRRTEARQQVHGLPE